MQEETREEMVEFPLLLSLLLMNTCFIHDAGAEGGSCFIHDAGAEEGSCK